MSNAPVIADESMCQRVRSRTLALQEQLKATYLSDQLPNPDQYLSDQLPNPDQYHSDQLPNPDQYLSDQLPNPNPDQYLSDQLPNPDQYHSDQLPNPDQYHSDQLPNPDQYLSDQLPNPDQYLSDQLPNPNPDQYHSDQLPNPDQYLSDQLPNPDQSSHLRHTPMLEAEMLHTRGEDGMAEEQVQSSQLSRLQKLRAHHNACEERYTKAYTKTANDEREKTMFLYQSMKTKPNRKMLGYETEESSSEFSEYIPETEDQSESDRSAKEESLAKNDKQQKRRKVQSKTSRSKPCKRKRVTRSSCLATSGTKESSSSDEHDSGESSSSDEQISCESSSPDNSNVKVMMLKKKTDGGRIYNKKYFCLFCSKPFSKMARHLESKHKDKPEVARAVAFPKGSKDRRLQVSLLRNKGNRCHNTQVLKEGKGLVIPRQQSIAPVTASDYLHCVNCEAYLKRRSLWRHMQRCHLSKKVKGMKPGKTRVQALCSYTEPVPESVNERFWRMVLEMHEDKITDVVRKEKIILKLGEHLFNKHGHDVTKHEYIRQKMRETGRLVLQGKQTGKLKEVSDFFVPANFPHVIDAVHSVSGLNEETNTYKAPSLALKLGHNLKKLASIIECEAMMSGDKNALNNVQAFKQICDTKWSECVSSQALRNLSEAKWNSPQLLPFADDVKKMHQYLDRESKEYQTKLEEEPSNKNWSELAKITLCQVILFNRRREGEVSKMSLNAFTLRDTSSTHPDVEFALSDLEKKLCKHFQRIEIRGKRGRKVPILLTPDMLTSMELLVKTRRNCEVPDENVFMFGRPQALSHFRGSDVIRKIAQSCGAKHPETLSSTRLRKHMATMSKVLNLKDNEMDDLADFLGHDIRVHRQYYRLPEGTLQLAKISKVLMAMERGQLSEFKGRNLDEIQIDPQERVLMDSDGSDSENETGNGASPSDSAEKSMKSTNEVEQPKNQQPAKVSSQNPRRKWTEEEIQAVEETLMDYIQSGKVPGTTCH
ncbi:uncharacterized protein LOC130095581 [Rhinichthys klamathensis goyatoka]|uniref:uncharacterized protein LOC130095581 n=1 Tax=Rhinichthys klamathensis goyatoka TaxID=3034132 RepID=UPI0024B5578B|nr:uncharacterized protein LOC130095581 [Rhinichthys klamathensis goyatoka]